ncbi:hypothetical protein Tco_0561960 [Tanacetum coccineum]
MEELRIAFQAWSDNIRQKKEQEEKRIAEEQVAKARYWKIPICNDDDEDDTIAITPVLPTMEPDNSLSMGDEHLSTIPEKEESSVEDLVPIPSESEDECECDYDDDDDDDDEESSIPLRDIIISGLPPCVAITPVLSTEEPVDSLIMEDEHLDTISATESDEIIKSSIEDLVPILSESEGIPDNMCDVPFHDNSPPLDISKDQFEEFSYSTRPAFLIFCYRVRRPFCFNLEEKSSGNPTSYTDLSLPDYEAFCYDSEPDSGDFTMDSFVIKSPIPVEDGDSFLENFETTPELETFKFDIEEKNSGSTTIHVDISLPDLECLYFKSEPDPGDLTSIIDPGIRENVSSTTNVNLPFEDDQSPLFAYVIWIFLPFLTYPVAPSYLISSGNEDTIFDLGISIYHSFMPGVSYRSGTFRKFNVYPNHLNESLMEILSSTCFPMDQ